MLFEDVRENLKDGCMINARLGRAGCCGVDWVAQGVYRLYIQKQNGKIVFLSLKDYDWAEYCPAYDYSGKNLFINEDYYMEVLSWNI